jgi:3-hydroxyisobutyrate dehydrogenase-like beta-hydroxyacid dehydrogenase
VTDVLLIGAGRIGLPVARHLVAVGHAVRVYDVRPEVRAEAEAVGAVWTHSYQDRPAELVVTVLPGSPELRAVMADLLPRLGGSTWVDLTSASPEVGAELAATAASVGVTYVEAPVGGGVPAARAGRLTLYTAGDQAAVDRLRPLLGAFASTIHYTGPAGTGYLTKLLVNLLWFTQATAVGEALLLGQSAGLDPAYLRGIFGRGPAASAFIEDSLPSLFTGDYLTTFGLDRIVEELDALRSFAAAQDSPAELISQVTAQYRAALDHFGPQTGELLGIAYLEQLAGRQLRPVFGPDWT